MTTVFIRLIQRGLLNFKAKKETCNTDAQGSDISLMKYLKIACNNTELLVPETHETRLMFLTPNNHKLISNVLGHRDATETITINHVLPYPTFRALIVFQSNVYAALARNNQHHLHPIMNILSVNNRTNRLYTAYLKQQ